MDKDIPKDVACELIRELLASFHSLENAMRLVQERCSNEEFKGFRSEAGRVAGGLYLLLEPLWKAYPDLAPEGLVVNPRKKKQAARGISACDLSCTGRLDAGLKRIRRTTAVNGESVD